MRIRGAGRTNRITDKRVPDARRPAKPRERLPSITARVLLACWILASTLIPGFFQAIFGADDGADARSLSASISTSGIAPVSGLTLITSGRTAGAGPITFQTTLPAGKACFLQLSGNTTNASQMPDPIVTGGVSVPAGGWVDNPSQFIGAGSTLDKRSFILVGIGNGVVNDTITIDWGASNAVIGATQYVTGSVDHGYTAGGAAGILIQAQWDQRKDGNAHTNMSLFGFLPTDPVNNLMVAFCTRFNTGIGANPDTYSNGFVESYSYQAATNDFKQTAAVGHAAQTLVTYGNGLLADNYVCLVEFRAAGSVAPRTFSTSSFSRYQGPGGTAAAFFDATDSATYQGALWDVAPPNNALIVIAVGSVRTLGPTLPAGATPVQTGGAVMARVPNQDVTLGNYRWSVWWVKAASYTTNRVQVNFNAIVQNSCAVIGGYYVGASGIADIVTPGSAAANTLTLGVGASTHADDAIFATFMSDVSLQTTGVPVFTPGNGYALLDKDAAGSKATGTDAAGNVGAVACWSNVVAGAVCAATIPGAGNILGVGVGIVHT